MAKAKRRVLNRDAILNEVDRNTVDVSVEEFYGPGAVIMLRSLSAAEAMEFIKMNKENKDENINHRIMVWLVQKCCVDEKGKDQFTADDVEDLGKRSIRMFVKLQKAAMQLNGFKEYYDAAEKVAQEEIKEATREEIKGVIEPPVDEVKEALKND